jgi:CRP-like cAMP-binding protein
MKANLVEFIKARVKQPRTDEIDAILDIFEEKHLAKGDIFKQPNTISKDLGFVVSGSVRMFAVKDNGDEITGNIIQPMSFMADMMSVRTQESTPIAIQCLEKTSALVAPILAMQRLLETNLALNILMREYIADNAVELGKRHLLFLTGTAKERYQFILENNPKLLKKFPLRFIASMIGITPTQLSRIRNQK